MAGTPGNHPGTARLPRAALVSGALVALTLIAVGLTLPLGLNGDLQYVIGGMHAHPAGGFADTFVHRPLAYRAAMATLVRGAATVGTDPAHMAAFEAAVRILADLATVALAFICWRLLVPLMGRREAAVVTGALAGAVIVAPNFDFLQPETLGAIATAAGVAIAIWPRHATAGPVIGGVLFGTAVALKLATLPLAPLGLLLVALVDGRRAWRATVGVVIGGALWLAASAQQPHELQWLRDMVALSPNAPTRVGIDLAGLWTAATVVSAKMIVSPVIAALPAAIVIVSRGVPAARRRTASVLVAATVLAVAPLVMQGANFLYHLAALPILATGLAAVAVARHPDDDGGPSWLMSLAVIGTGALGLPLLLMPPDGRDAMAPFVITAAALLGLGAGLLAFGVGHRIARVPRIPAAAQRSLAAVAIVMAVAPAVVPAAAWSPIPSLTPYTNGGWADAARRVRASDVEAVAGVAPDATVLYLAYGTAAYHMGLRTDCAYPSPLFLQRSAFRGYIRELASYADTVRCILRTRASVLVLERGWMRWDRLDPRVRRLVERRFSCPVLATHHAIEICPRR